MLFTCLDVLITSQQKAFMDHDYAWITQWEIEHVPRYGQYQVGPQSRPGLDSPILSLRVLFVRSVQRLATE